MPRLAPCRPVAGRRPPPVRVPALTRLVIALAALAGLGLPSRPAHAQSAVVVAACGSPPVAYTAGATRAVTQNTSGLACSSATATGTFDDAAVSATGSGVPAAASYDGINVAGNLRGQTGVNPSGAIFAGQTDLSSVAGATVKTGAGTAAGTIRVELPTDGTGLVNTAQSGTWTVQPGNTANTTPWLTTGVPSSAAGAGTTPVVSTAAEASHVLKAGAGNLYRIAVTTGATAGYLLVFNATSAPANGAVTPLLCRQVAANSSLEVDHAAAPDRYATGITAAFSSTGCFTLTTSATAMFEGAVQ